MGGAEANNPASLIPSTVNRARSESSVLISRGPGEISRCAMGSAQVWQSHTGLAPL